MAEIKCPNCGTLISLEQSDLDTVVAQVRDEQFRLDLEERTKAMEAENERSLELVRAQAQTRVVEVESRKEAELSQLRAQLQAQEQSHQAQTELAVAQASAAAANELNALRESVREKEAQLASQREQLELQQQLAVAQAVAESQKQRDELESQLRMSQAQHEASEARLREQLLEQQHAKDEVIAYQQGEIERMKDMKARLSTKMVGESLEQHCLYEFERIRAVAFPKAYFEKDNDASQGTKGDFIFREEDDEGNEVISIMFEMKNESDTNSVKRKNEDHLPKLDKDRTKKGCEYAVLVSLLEPDNELYNEGIVDVSHRFPKMYVVRPQFFIPIISLLRNASLSALQYKRELALVRQQDLDITHFEEDLEVFKQGFFKNFGDASLRFEDAIKAIDKAIADLERAKEKLLVSEKHLSAANTKLEGLTVKKLTRKNPTMREKFKALKETGDDESVAIDSSEVADAETEDAKKAAPARGKGRRGKGSARNSHEE